MNSLDSAKINQMAYDMVAKFKPDLNKFNNGKEFTELYNSNIKFCQVRFQDKNISRKYVFKETNFNMDLDKKEEFWKEVEDYNKKLKKAQDAAIVEFGLSKYDEETYRYNYRVGTDIGLSHVAVYERHKPTEKREQEEMYERYKNEPEPECSSCGDGGCIHCRPNWFI